MTATPARVLEGREPRRASTARVWRRSQVSFGVAELPATTRALVQRWTQQHQGLDPQPAHGPVHHRGLRVRLDIPRLTTIPTLDGLVRPAAHAAPRRRLHRDASTRRSPTETPAPPRGRRLRRSTWPTTRRSTPPLPGVPGAEHVRMTFPFFGADADADPRTGRRATGPPDDGARARRPDPHLRALAAARRRARARPRSTSSACSTTSAATSYTYTEVPPTESRDARRLPVRRQAGLLPAVLGRDGAAAADGRHPRARGHRLLDRRDRHQDRRVHRARLRRALLGRGLLPRTGAGSRSTRRPPPRPPAASPPTPRSVPGSSTRRGAVSFGGDPLAERGAGVPVAAESRPVVARSRRSSPARWPLLGLGFLGRPPLAPRRAARALASSSARCGARAASPRPARPCTRSSCASPSTPAAAGYVRALRESRYRDAPGHPTRAQRRGLRSELGRGGGILGRLRAWWALPPQVTSRAYNWWDGRCL